jgi:Fe-S-cluster-containing dehydrogenase component
MPISRREVLKGAVASGAVTALVTRTEARERVEAAPDAVGMLFDSTLCIGCRACQSACKVANDLPADKVRAGGGVYDAPIDLNSTTKNIVKAYATGDRHVFVKQQCMHCVDPSCVSACMLGALHKEGEGTRHAPAERKGTGVVVYDKGTCVGCRYCQIACAFNVPKFEWRDAFPLIVKCELCRHRAKEAAAGPLAIANPACCEACPREAVIYGWRRELLAEAKRRLAAEPARYNGQVYGEREGGGTQVLYLAPAGVSFQQLGLPALPDRSAAQFSESVSHAPYFHGVTPIALYAAMAFVIRRNARKQDAAEHREEDES